MRDYQEACLVAMDAAWQRGVRRQLVALPTGAGKTVIFCELLRRRAAPTLILAHRDELIQQTIEKIHLVAPHLTVGVVKAERQEPGESVTVASVQTLARPARLATLPDYYRTVIVDEAHHATAPTYQAILEHVGALEPNGPYLVGFTATPDRGDGVGLANTFTEVVYERTILEMIAAGYLADLRAIQIWLAAAGLDAVPTRHGDFADGALGTALLAANAPAHTVAAYQAHAAGRKALAFTPTVAVAHAMAAAFQQAGIAAEALDGTTPIEQRRAILARLKAGTTRVVANCAVLIEGFDEPSVDCIIVARPTRSRPFYAQMIGRGTRIYPGKPDCLILDLVGATRHPLVTAASLFGVAPQAIAETGVGEHIAAVAQAQREGEQQATARGRLVAQAVDLFHRRPLRWLKAGERFVLTLGDGWLTLEPGVDGWAVRRHVRDQGSRLLAQGLPLDYAQGRAEDYAREQGALVLLSPEAAWRREPATDRQRWRLRHLGVRVPAELTKGEASDLIGMAESGSTCA